MIADVERVLAAARAAVADRDAVIERVRALADAQSPFVLTVSLRDALDPPLIPRAALSAAPTPEVDEADDGPDLCRTCGAVCDDDLGCECGVECARPARGGIDPVSGLRERAARAAEQDWRFNRHKGGVDAFVAGAEWALASLDHPETVAEVERVLTEALHGAMEWQYDQCDHGTYAGGPSNGEPYAMCAILARRQTPAVLAHLAGRS